MGSFFYIIRPQEYRLSPLKGYWLTKKFPQKQHTLPLFRESKCQRKEPGPGFDPRALNLKPISLTITSLSVPPLVLHQHVDRGIDYEKISTFFQMFSS